jgi:hypothetical protein
VNVFFILKTDLDTLENLMREDVLYFVFQKMFLFFRKQKNKKKFIAFFSIFAGTRPKKGYKSAKNGPK